MGCGVVVVVVAAVEVAVAAELDAAGCRDKSGPSPGALISL